MRSAEPVVFVHRAAPFDLEWGSEPHFAIGRVLPHLLEL